MRVAVILLVMLSGCQKSFDEQYAETEDKVRAAEARLDAEMAKEAAREPGETTKD